MKKIHIRLVMTTVVLVAAFAMIALGAAQQTKHQEVDTLNCLECHTCEQPTAQDMCLKPCPTLRMPTAHAKHNLSEAPDTFLIGELSDLYQPVDFNHKLHADMAQMGKGCETCHHYSPPGHIPPCADCHGGEKNPENLRQPSLKGAYHRQCLSCHREWSHDTKCIICHLPTPGGALARPGMDSTDIIGISHPVITVPDKKVYTTPYEQGPVVTLHHQQHIDLFGLRCVDCHKEENCSYCHDLQAQSRPSKTDEEIHAICNDCHIKDACSKCHDHKEKPGFSHASTGWPLNRFHKDLSCRACHPTGKQIARLNNQCTSCHAGWNQQNFSHVVTGLKLDEIHGELECGDCHVDLKYSNKPDCSGCHDDGRTAEDAPPGEYVQKLSLQ
ncbi:MAG: cytochrome c3 family protein [Candidatus Zixiibacteriota bacterium]